MTAGDGGLPDGAALEIAFAARKAPFTAWRRRRMSLSKDYGIALMRTRAVPSIASRRAAARERSMIRPPWYGPRSLIVTMTVLPLVRWVTFTGVPKGKLRWAAVRACWLKRLPLAVFLP